MAGEHGYGYGGIKENLYLISAIIYVGGMFLLLYVYQNIPNTNYTLIPTVAYLSTFGALILFAQMLVAAWKTPKEPMES
jgi:hypothetical protein